MSEINSYKADLLDRLKDLQYAQLYLDAAAKESQETFLLALRDVAEARKGMAQLADQADVNRENLYRALSEEGNPRLSTLGSILDALGMDLSVSLRSPITATPTAGTLVTTTTFNAMAAAGTTVNVSAQVASKGPGDYLVLPAMQGLQVAGPQKYLRILQGTSTFVAA